MTSGAASQIGWSVWQSCRDGSSVHAVRGRKYSKQPGAVSVIHDVSATERRRRRSAFIVSALVCRGGGRLAAGIDAGSHQPAQLRAISTATRDAAGVPGITRGSSVIDASEHGRRHSACLQYGSGCSGESQPSVRDAQRRRIHSAACSQDFNGSSAPATDSWRRFRYPTGDTYLA